MATVVRTIGTATRDYSTIQAWEDATDNHLISAKDIEQGECYNDSEFTPSAAIVFAGATTNATYFRKLTAASGESFQDHANASTNALTYNQSNGVGVASTVGYNKALTVNESYFQLERLQIKQGTAGSFNAPLYLYSASDIVCKDLILVNNNNDVAGVALRTLTSTAMKLINVLGIQNKSGATYIVDIAGGGDAKNCSFVAPSDLASAPGTGMRTQYGTMNFTNCAVFGASAFATGGGTRNYTTCGTDVASPPSGVTGSLTYTNQFEGTTVSGSDFRLKSGADLIDAGTTDTDAANDIIGTSRSSYDIGVWEFVSAATGSSHRTPGGGWGGRVICG